MREPFGLAKNRSMFQVADQLLGMADDLRKETAPSSSVPPAMPKLEPISSSTQVFWMGIITPDLIAVLDKAALAQAQARLADARAKGEAALVNADYAQKTADAAAQTVAAWEKQRADADAAAVRTREAEAQANAEWTAVYKDELDAVKTLNAARLWDIANNAKYELSAARARADTARANLTAAQAKAQAAFANYIDAGNAVLQMRGTGNADAIARAEEAEQRAKADLAAARKAVESTEFDVDSAGTDVTSAERKVASTRDEAVKAGVNPDGPRVNAEQARADLDAASQRQKAALELQLKTGAENRVAQERAAAVKRAEDAAKAEAARLAEEAKRAKDAADAAVAEFRAANADYDRLLKKSP